MFNEKMFRQGCSSFKLTDEKAAAKKKNETNEAQDALKNYN
jgi:hypothetical protein